MLAGHLAHGGHLDALYDHDSARFGRINSPLVTEEINALGLSFHPTPFVYPPLGAVLAAPLARVDFTVLQRVWTVLAEALVVAGYAFAARVYAPTCR